MPRPLSQEKKREKTKESLKNALLSNKMSEKFLEDKVEEYMSFYTDATAEKRRISAEMRSILSFLGLKPSDVVLSSGAADDEEL